MRRPTILLLFAALALPACKTPNPPPERSVGQQEALAKSAKWDLDKARTELSELNAVIAAVVDKDQRKDFEEQSKQLEKRLDDVTKEIKDYQRNADTEGVAGVMMSGLADVRADIERLRSVVASRDY